MPPVSAPHVYTIPPHRAFADALAAGLIARYGKERLGFARGIVLLPNNRSARAITDAFVRRAGGGLLLPRLVPIGDPTLDERLGSLLDPIDEPLPPAVEPLQRSLILARLIQDAKEKTGEPIMAAEAMRLAAELGRTLDQLLVEEIDPARLGRLIDPLVEPELSAHWQTSLATLELILSRWPNELKRLGRIDAADRRNRLLGRVAARWADAPPPGFVAAAGIPIAAPAVARLLRAVAWLPEGMVVLPGLDQHMPEEEWAALGPHAPDPDTGRRARNIETHPQYQLKRLLDRMGVARGEVQRWRRGGGRDAPAQRTLAIGNAMAPAAFTGKWRDLKPAARRLSGVRAIELANPAEEAQTIAIALREAIEVEGRTAALVTPDRDLARRVVAHLGRWGIEADDSAGRPLSATPPGVLLIALAQASAEGFAPVPLLAVLKHPLVGMGERRGAWLDGVRQLDLALRGPRPAAGLSGIERHLAGGDARARRVRAPAEPWWRETMAGLAPLETAFTNGKAGLGAYLAGLREVAGALCGDALWAGQAGRAAADLFAALEEHASEGPAELTPDDLVALLRQCMDAIAVRPAQGGHPRIFLWGLIEARLQQADLMILGGLNEGVWPPLPTPDPWLAPQIRSALGLPGLERSIGLSAHDFASGLGAPRVLVTRARRDARAPAVASRFWLRLEAMTGGLTRAVPLRRWAQALDKAVVPVAPAPRPAPSPPVADRPKRIAVTKVDRLKADPFAFYADAMLRLSRLEAIDADPGPAWRGSAVHAVFEAWMKEDGCDPAKLAPRARAMLGEIAAHPVLKALWTPRLMEAIEWVADRMAAEAAEGRRPLVAELKGKAEIAGVMLDGTVDRIDRLADGSLAIVDYKTGKPPGTKQVAAGFAMQLGLLGLIAEHGGFEGVEGVPSQFEYWSLSQKRGQLGFVESPVSHRAGAIPPEDFTRTAARLFEAAAEAWLLGEEPFTARLHPEYAPYGDYDQLMRLDEWYGRG
ncbi:MAG TPA: double-strand break repair protein AddB [Sphingomonadaceae bacterium]|nr:double-strand break repair protein AddB [Sphingomonadaceae bacterium]